MILQDIAAEVNKTSTPFTRTSNVSATYTRDGQCPNTGVHTPDGSIFIGQYDGNKWRSDSVKPYHKQIMDARASGNHSDQTARSQKRWINAMKRNNKKLKSLESKISAAKVQLEEAKSNQVSFADDKDDKDYNAGNSFGGKNSKKD